ncbi:MAG: lysophospholipid acyltransferase family protein [Actinomycetota bacterium]
MMYWLLKNIFLGPLLRLLYRPKAKGLANLPGDGPVIVASNHVSFIDSMFIPLVVKRRVVFLGKADYFSSRRTAWFFKAAGVIPVRREGGSASEAAIQAGVRELKTGHVVGIYPEGTRSPDGRLYRGKTGLARMALLARCPIVPVAVFGTRELQPIGRRLPKLSGRIEVQFGKPLAFDRFFGQEADRFVLRSITDEVMYEIMMLSGQEYVDEYASKVKAQQAEEAAPAPAPDVVDVAAEERRSDRPEEAKT